MHYAVLISALGQNDSDHDYVMLAYGSCITNETSIIITLSSRTKTNCIMHCIVYYLILTQSDVVGSSTTSHTCKSGSLVELCASRSTQWCKTSWTDGIVTSQKSSLSRVSLSMCSDSLDDEVLSLPRPTSFQKPVLLYTTTCTRGPHT